MLERFAQHARSAVVDARYEAERRGDRRIGTDHLLIALLQDDAVARLVGVDGSAARDAADRLDREALTAIGFSLGELPPGGPAPVGRRVRLMTVGARTVIQRALADATAERARAITSRHILLALLDPPRPDPAASLFEAIVADPHALRQRLASAA